MRLRRRRRRDLAERLRPYLPERIAPEPMVDADPIRMFLFRWMIETGDPLEVVAQGFAIEESVVRSVLSGELRKLPWHRADELSRRLGMK